MKFSANDLYLSYGENPQVWLHDCVFTIKRDGEDLLFEFPEGFQFQKDGQCFRCARGTIRAVKVGEEDVQIFAGQQTVQQVELNPLVTGESWTERTEVRPIPPQEL